MVAMDSTVHLRFILHEDPDASLALYRDCPGVLVLLRNGLG